MASAAMVLLTVLKEALAASLSAGVACAFLSALLPRLASDDGNTGVGVMQDTPVASLWAGSSFDAAVFKVGNPELLMVLPTGT